MRVVVFFLLVSILPFNLYSAPCYGTKMPKKKSFFIGTETHIIFDRKLEKELGRVRSLQHFLDLSYGIFDWLSLDLKGGAGYIKQHPGISDEVDYPTGFAGGYGLRLRLYENEKSKIVLGFQHISVHPKKIHLGGIKNQAVLDDWQFSLLASYRVSKYTPYLGAKYSRVDYIHWVEDDRKRNMSDLTKTLGLVCGIDLPLTENVWINLEGQFLDGKAASVAVNYSF